MLSEHLKTIEKQLKSKKQTKPKLQVSCNFSGCHTHTIEANKFAIGAWELAAIGLQLQQLSQQQTKTQIKNQTPPRLFWHTIAGKKPHKENKP